MMKKCFCPRLWMLVLLLAASSLPVIAQGVKISANPGNPDPSAMLEVGDSTKGFLLPRLTTAQRNAISNPAIGLQIVNITTECIEVYFSGGWKPVVCDCNQPPAQPGNITGPAAFCANQQGVAYSVSPVTGASSYTWTVPNGAVVASGQGTNNIVVDFGNNSGVISVTAQNTCGTSSATQINVTVSAPDASFQPLVASVNAPVTFTPQPGYASYNWTFQGGSPGTSTQQNPQVTWNAAGTYTVTLTVTDNNGCTATLSQSVTVSGCQPTVVTFTNCGATGPLGPDQNQCNAVYGPGVVTVTNGIQFWTVPQTGNYTIETVGAKGGGVDGGAGARIVGEFSLTAGTVLKILVGQEGVALLTNRYDYSGGGGSFVTNTSNIPYVVAGGGGGANVVNVNSNATITTTGANGGGSFGVGGSNGNGGTHNVQTSDGGAGLNTNGGSGNPNPAPQSFINGGRGGCNTWAGGCGAEGGFGGGGASNRNSVSFWSYGGGGGYSGGGSGYATSSYAGGGASYNSGSNQVNQAGYNTSGHGYVVITSICP